MQRNTTSIDAITAGDLAHARAEFYAARREFNRALKTGDNTKIEARRAIMDDARATHDDLRALSRA